MNFEISKSNMRSLPEVLSLLYVAVYLLFPYKPFNHAVSIHTLILLSGVLAVLMLHFSGLRRFAFERTFVSVGLLLFFSFFVSTSVVHGQIWPSQSLVAYYVSFLTFMYLGLYLPRIPTKFSDWLAWYLLVFSILSISQVFFGRNFYVCGYFGQQVFKSTFLAWGFASSSTLAAGIVTWALCVLCVQYLSVRGVPFRRDLLFSSAIFFGAAALFYSLSRSAWLIMLFALVVMVPVVFVKRGSFARLGKLLLYMAVSLLIFGVVLQPASFQNERKMKFIRQAVSAPEQALEKDVSLNTRRAALDLAVKSIAVNPVWGIGVDGFSGLYERYYRGTLSKLPIKVDDVYFRITPHNSYLFYAVELGLLPLTVILIIGIMVFKRMGAVPLANPAFSFLFAAVVVGLWLATNDFIRERFCWIVFALALSFSRQKGIEDES